MIKLFLKADQKVHKINRFIRDRISKQFFFLANETDIYIYIYK